MNYSQFFNFSNVQNNNCNYDKFEKIYNNTKCKDILDYNYFCTIFDDLVKYLENYDNINYIELFYNQDIIEGLDKIINKESIGNILLLNDIFNFLILDKNIYRNYILSLIVFFNFNQDELEKIKNTEFYDYSNAFFCYELLPIIYIYSNYFFTQDSDKYNFTNKDSYIRSLLHDEYTGCKCNNNELNKTSLLNYNDYKLVNKIFGRYNTFCDSWSSIWYGFTMRKREDDPNLSKVENLINKCKRLDDDNDYNDNENNCKNNDNDSDSDYSDYYDGEQVSYDFSVEEINLMNNLVTKYKINKYFQKKYAYDCDFTLDNNISLSNLMPEILIALNRFNPENNLIFDKKNINEDKVIEYLTIAGLCYNTQLFKKMVEYYDVKNFKFEKLRECYWSIHKRELREYFYKIVKINNPNFTESGGGTGGGINL